MSDTTSDTTSVSVDFYPAGSANSSPIVTANLVDNRKFLTVNLQCQDASKLVSATVFIDSLQESNIASLKSYPLRVGANYIGTSTTVSSNDIVYAFSEYERYAIKMKVLTKDGTLTTLFSKFSYGPASDEDTQNLTCYNFLYRPDGGDTISESAKITDPGAISNGSTITISCPIDFARLPKEDQAPEGDDTRTPYGVLFTFEEEDNYNNNSEVAPDNCEQLSEYSAFMAYSDSNVYELLVNELTNDSIYLVNVEFLYSDGFTVSKTLQDKAYVITSPEIISVTAYGLGVDKSDADNQSISQVANIFLAVDSAPVNIATAGSNVTFELQQSGVVYYTASILTSTATTVGNTIKYTVNQTDLVAVANPAVSIVELPNGSFQFDVVATLTYEITGSSDITKTSNLVSANFNSDINQLPSFSIGNAWILASVTTPSDLFPLRQVTSAEGYTAAPEFGIVGNVSKTDFYGSAIESGLFQDLDKTTTLHKFTVSVNEAAPVPINRLYQIQGDLNLTDQENYVELMEKREAVYEVNGVETVLPSSAVTQLKSQSNTIINYSASGSEYDGWTIANTGPGTNGAASGKLPKVDLYFYAFAGIGSSFTMAEANGAGLYGVFYQNAGALEYPFFNVYTAPTTGSGDDRAPGFYKSRILYSAVNDALGNTVSNSARVGLTFVFTGVDDGTLFSEVPAARRVKFAINEAYSDLSTNKIDDVKSQPVKFLTVQTSSNAATSSAGSFNFTLLETGMFTSNASYNSLSLRLNQPKPRMLYSATGQFPNIPGPAGVVGSEQPPIYFLIPYSNGLFQQQDSVAVSIQIIAPKNSATLPDPTSSNEQIVVHKVNTYEMTLGTSSEPTFIGGVLTVPISNSTTDDSGDIYFESATLIITDGGTPSSASTDVTNDGFFNITQNVPSSGANKSVTYEVFYTISDPNGLDINGPVSTAYTVKLTDTPTEENIVISNFSYTTYNVNNKSSFKFDILFQDVGTTSVDGCYVYFQSAEIPNTLVQTMYRVNNGVETNNQLNNVVVLQDTTEPSDLVDGINITDSSGSPSTNLWYYYTGGTIIFVPFHFAAVTSNSGGTISSLDSIEKSMNNIPTTILPVNDLALTGGVKESISATKTTWDNELYTQYNEKVDVRAEYVSTQYKYDYPQSLTSTIFVTNTPALYGSGPPAQTPPPALASNQGLYFRKSGVIGTGSKVLFWGLAPSTGMKVKDVINMRFNCNIPVTSPLQRDEEIPYVGFYTKRKEDGNDRSGGYRARITFSADRLNSDFSGNYSFLINVASPTVTSVIPVPAGYTDLSYSLASNSLFPTGSSSIADILDDEINYFYIGVSSGAASYQQVFVQSLRMQIPNSNLRDYKFIRTGEPQNTGFIDTTSVANFPNYTGEGVQTVDISGYLSTYKTSVQVKVTAVNDNSEYFSEATDLQFESVSVNTAPMTVSVKRGTNPTTLQAQYGAYTVDPLTAGSLVVASNQLVDTTDGEVLDLISVNGEPVSAGSANALNQLPAPATNTYDLDADFGLGDKLKLGMQIVAGVEYTVSDQETALDSQPLQLTNSQETPLIVAGKPSVTIAPQYQMLGTGEYAGRVAIGMSIDVNGLYEQGIQSFVAVVGQVSDYTDPADNGDGQGVQYLLAFNSTKAVPPTYASQDAASAAANSNDNIAAQEKVDLTVDDVTGFYEESTGNWTLVTGDLTAGDATLLYAPADSGLDLTRNISVMVVVSTRLAIDFAVGDVAPPPPTTEAVISVDYNGMVTFSTAGSRDARGNTRFLIITNNKTSFVTANEITPDANNTTTRSIWNAYFDLEVIGQINNTSNRIVLLRILSSDYNTTFSEANNVTLVGDPPSTNEIISIQRHIDGSNKIRVVFSTDSKTVLNLSDTGMIIFFASGGSNGVSLNVTPDPSNTASRLLYNAVGTTVNKIEMSGGFRLGGAQLYTLVNGATLTFITQYNLLLLADGTF